MELQDPSLTPSSASAESYLGVLEDSGWGGKARLHREANLHKYYWEMVHKELRRKDSKSLKFQNFLGISLI